jgi:hypothetical protein
MEDVVASCKKSAVQGMEMFLRNFSYVPDDKLAWTPTPTSKSAIHVAAHTALYAGRFARMINDRKLPQVDDIPAWMARQNAEEAAITCRKEMEAIFRQGTDEVLAALDSLQPDEIDMSLDGPGWSMPMTQLMNLPGWHATLHLGQIDYLQTCWDDQEIYVG